MDYEKFELGDVSLLSGEELNSAFLIYKTYGKLNKGKDNVVVMPTFYTGSHQRNEGFFGEGRSIDPAKHFIVSINLFGNGLSSSPSNSKSPQDGPRFSKMALDGSKMGRVGPRCPPRCPAMSPRWSRMALNGLVFLSCFSSDMLAHWRFYVQRLF